MQTLLIFNSESIDSLLCKHIVMSLFPEPMTYSFYDIGKSEKFFLPDATQTIDNHRFIFIGTYPTLEWHNAVLSTPDNTKRIEIYTTYKNDDYSFDEFYSKLYLIDSYSSENTIAHKFLKQNFQLISAQNTIIVNQQPYNNRELIFNKIHAAIKPLVTVAKFNDAIRLLNPADDNVIANFILNENKFSIADYVVNLLRNSFVNDLSMKFFTFIDNPVIISYLSVLNQNPKTQDYLIKTINHNTIEINDISFIEYVKHIDNTKVIITYSSVDEPITMEPTYNRQFGNVSVDSKTKKLVDYLVANFHFTYQNFMDMVSVESVEGYKLSFNWDNSVNVEVPIDVYLSIKNAEEV